MSANAKVIVPNKMWIVEESGTKLGTLNKEKNGYAFFRKGIKLELHDLSEVKAKFGSEIFKENIAAIKATAKIPDQYQIYDFPCNDKPYNPVYNVKNRLPIYAKGAKSKSLYCAGHYIIQFRKGWVKSLCPKLITLERYPYQGPFKTLIEMRAALATMNRL